MKLNGIEKFFKRDVNDEIVDFKQLIMMVSHH